MAYYEMDKNADSAKMYIAKRKDNKFGMEWSEFNAF